MTETNSGFSIGHGVKRYLVNSNRVEPVRVVVVGKGEGNLPDANDPINVINRRVQFKALD